MTFFLFWNRHGRPSEIAYIPGKKLVSVKPMMVSWNILQYIVAGTKTVFVYLFVVYFRRVLFESFSQMKYPPLSQVDCRGDEKGLLACPHTYTTAGWPIFLITTKHESVKVKVWKCPHTYTTAGWPIFLTQKEFPGNSPGSPFITGPMCARVWHRHSCWGSLPSHA